MLQLVSTFSSPVVSIDRQDADQELRQRMQKPQRHRLLHGYPLAAAMPSRQANGHEELFFDPAADRQLLVGVLPHPFCNPAVSGCGFCTFPHEAFNAARSAAVVEHVLREIDQRLHLQPELNHRPVAGLYFGGGTANLTPAESFRQLCRALAAAFDLSGAEVTLEGIPSYFVKRRPLLIDILRDELPARHHRLSMGIQTFDEAQLGRMGRLAFGTADTFREVVELGHRQGFTVSADLLFNLPGQTLEQMRNDITKAVAIGLDHLGLYHLVLFAGLGTAWSRAPDLLAGLPCNVAAAERWLRLRAMLLANGFYQTTLTNFERQQFRDRARRFQYEEHSFRPDRYEMLGFGPSAISFSANSDFDTALKTLNPDSAADYMAAIENRPTAWDRFFRYGPGDLRVFYLTRRLAALEIDRRQYESLFGTDVLADFERELAALTNEKLVTIALEAIRPTPRGVFYADSIAALFAWRQVQRLRFSARQRGPDKAKEQSAYDNGRGHM